MPNSLDRFYLIDVFTGWERVLQDEKKLGIWKSGGKYMKNGEKLNTYPSMREDNIMNLNLNSYYQ